MRIAVTGGSGSVGKHVLRMAVAQGHTVRNIDRVAPPAGSVPDSVDFVNAELSDYQAFYDAINGTKKRIVVRQFCLHILDALWHTPGRRRHPIDVAHGMPLRYRHAEHMLTDAPTPTSYRNTHFYPFSK